MVSSILDNFSYADWLHVLAKNVSPSIVPHQSQPELQVVMRLLKSKVYVNVFMVAKLWRRYESPENVASYNIVYSSRRCIRMPYWHNMHLGATCITHNTWYLTRSCPFPLWTMLGLQGRRHSRHHQYLKVIGCKDESSAP